MSDTETNGQGRSHETELGRVVPDDPFWNLTDGVRPAPPIPGLFADICASTGKHVYDSVYGPRECARCGARTARRRWFR